MDWRDSIRSDSKIAASKSVGKGTHFAVEFLLDLYGAGWTEAQILESYTHLTSEASRAVHACAAKSVRAAERRIGVEPTVWHDLQAVC